MSNKELYETIYNSIEPSMSAKLDGSIDNLRKKGAEWIMRQVLMPTISIGTDRQLPDYFNKFVGYGRKAIENAIYFRDGHKCHYCDSRAVMVREIRPAFMGGHSHPRNMIAVCWECNKEVSELLKDNLELAVKRTFELLDLDNPQKNLGDFSSEM